MKISILKPVLFLIFFQQNALTAQQNSGLKKNEYADINFSLGWHNTWFLDKHSIDDFLKKSYGKHDGEYLKLTYIKGAFYTSNKFCYSIDYRYFVRAVNAKYLEKGGILERWHTAVNIGFGKTIYKKKATTLTPMVYFSTRYNGSEDVLVDKTPVLDVSFSYRKKCLGLGLGMSLKQKIYKRINIGLDLIYNHFFQKSKANFIIPGYEDYIRNYKINRDALNFCLTLGYGINMKIFKRRSINK